MKLLAQSSWWVVNKDIAKKLGIEASLILSYLCDKNEYHKARGELVFGRKNSDKLFFYCTSKMIEEETTITRKPMEIAIQKLVESGCIIIEKIGMPAKNFYSVCEEGIIDLMKKNENTSVETTVCPKWTNLFVQNGQTCLSKMDKLVCPKWTLNNNIFINNNNKETNTNNNNIIKVDNFDKKYFLIEEGKRAGEWATVGECFDIFWKIYPRKVGKGDAKKRFLIATNKTNWETLYKGILNYVNRIKKNNIDIKYIKHPSTRLNQECWNDELKDYKQKNYIQTQQDYINELKEEEKKVKEKRSYKSLFQRELLEDDIL